MQAADFLLTFSQLGLVVIGFISILYFFLEKTKVTNRDKQAIKFIFNHSIALVFISLLPFPFYYTIKDSSTIGSTPSIVFALYCLWSGLSTIYRVFEIEPSKPLPIIIGHIMPALFFSFILIFYRYDVAIYVSALIWLFFTTIMQFIISFVKHSSSQITDGKD